MANPFENADGTYLVLVNEEGQYSLWPGFIDVPSGWTVVHEQKGREASLPCTYRGLFVGIATM